MATIKDIGQSCGVSKATVSRYINGSGYVSREVGQRIKKAIQELDYVPSATARSLSTKNSKVIGVVIPEINNPFFGDIMKGIGDMADRKGFNILYCGSDNKRPKELKALDLLRSYDIEGLLIAPAAGETTQSIDQEDFIKAVDRLDVPVVLIDRKIKDNKWAGVFLDNYQGAYEATECLIQQGHHAIAVIQGNMNLLLAKERYQGYLDAMEDHGLKVEKEWIIKGDFKTEVTYQNMAQFMASLHKTTAIFSPNNLSTLGVLRAFNEAGVDLPRDYGMVGFDDIKTLKNLGIKITVIHHDAVKMGEKAMEVLVDQIISPSSKQAEYIIKSELIRRGSEKKPV